MLMRSITGCATAAALLLAPGLAGAVSVTVLESASNPSSTAAGGWVDTSQSLAIPTGATWDPETGPAQQTAALSAGAARSPFGVDGISYYYVSNLSDPVSPVTLTFGTPALDVTMLWGSIDSYNSLTFGLQDGPDQTFTGTQIAQMIDPDVDTNTSNFSIVALLRFSSALNPITSMTFTSPIGGTGNGVAFEFSNVSATPVPLPAGGVLLLTGLAGFAFLRRRQTKKAA